MTKNSGQNCVKCLGAATEKYVKRRSAAADWGSYGRPRHLELPYVVEMFRNILLVLRQNNLLFHFTRNHMSCKPALVVNIL